MLNLWCCLCPHVSQVLLESARWVLKQEQIDQEDKFNFEWVSIIIYNFGLQVVFLIKKGVFYTVLSSKLLLIQWD